MHAFARHLNLELNQGTPLQDLDRLLAGTGTLIRQIGIRSLLEFSPSPRRMKPESWQIVQCVMATQGRQVA